MLIEVEVVNAQDSNFNQVRIGSTVVQVKATDLEVAQPKLPEAETAPGAEAASDVPPSI